MSRILNYVLKHKKLILLGTIFMLGVIGVDQLLPLLQMALVDKVIGNGEHQLFMTIIIIMAILTISKSILGFLKEFTYDFMGSKVHTELKNDLFSHLQSFEFAYYDDMNTGELMSRINEDIENIWQTLNFGLRLFIENIFYFLISAVIIFILDWRLASICILLMVPIAFITMKIEKLFGATYGKLSDHAAVINTTAQENIAGVRLVKAFAREKHEITKFLGLNRANYDLNMELTHTSATYLPIIEFLTNMASVAMIVVGGVFILNESMSMGVLVAFSNYIWSLIWPLRQLGWLVGLLSRNEASAKKVFAILDRSSHIQSLPNAYKPSHINGDITFNHVYFKYKDTLVLKDINLTIPKGSRVAIMGTTGSGKSSLINLLGRYYDVCEGEVLIDGVNIKEYDLQTLRNHMSIVPQDTFLFSDTIAHNISFSNHTASELEIKAVCKKACILDFIENLENGFGTLVGERGLGLSGGQKQRITIARALLRKAPILVLDDATSALDMETEHELLHGLNELGSCFTTFIIAHRISAVKNADIILYLEDGIIKEQGTHEELLAQKGLYYSIFCKQCKDFISSQERGVRIG